MLWSQFNNKSIYHETGQNNFIIEDLSYETVLDLLSPLIAT